MNFKMSYVIWFIILLVFLALCAIVFLFWRGSFSTELVKKTICINGKCFFVEVADSYALREKGLMNRKELDKDSGMFFVFNKYGKYPFWMKNTLIPLDIIWIKDNKIVFIAENVQPCKTIICPEVNPNTDANYVLEINAGLSKEFGFKIGDEIK